MSEKEIKKTIRQVLLALMIILSGTFLTYAHADFGPKPELTIQVENAPTGDYYLDLLVDYNGSFDNLQHLDEDYDAEKLALLTGYSEDGWYPAIAHGTRVPFFGKLKGVPENGLMIHRFSYVGVPNTYKIIIVTPENEIEVSEVFTKRAFQEQVTLDYETLELKVHSKFGLYLIQFFLTFTPTVIIEGLILILFRFPFKRNLKPFLLTNLATQTMLTIVLGIAAVRVGIFGSVIFVLPLAELVILIAETNIYRRTLSGKSKGRATAYGIVANLISFAAGIFAATTLYVL